jgi:polyhydroxybutyrate depolymerase
MAPRRSKRHPRPSRALSTQLLALIAITTASAACSSAEPSEPDAIQPIDLSPLGGDRPVDPYVPASYKPGTPTPLVILLHGFGAAGVLQELVYRLKPVAEERGFLYLAPDGTENSESKRFWNATDACCDFEGSGVDDVAYLRGLIDEAKKRFTVDPKRVFVTGHSNGGFMSFRMACDQADVVAAIASLAGSTWKDPSKCSPSEPVSVLAIHGTADEDVLYEGEATTPEYAGYPGAKATIAEWAERAGCDPTPDTTAPPIDISEKIAGAETSITRYKDCQPGGAAELWTMEGEGHIPATGEDFGASIIDFFYAHPKP